jgi:hypothetical protein
MFRRGNRWGAVHARGTVRGGVPHADRFGLGGAIVVPAIGTARRTAWGQGGGCGAAVQQGTSREAQATAQEFGRLPYARASFERVAHLVGALAVADHQDIEDALIEPWKCPRRQLR